MFDKEKLKDNFFKDVNNANKEDVEEVLKKKNQY